MNIQSPRALVPALWLALAAASLGAAAPPATAQSAAPAARASSANLLGAGEIERKAKAEGIVVTEIDMKTRLAEVEGYDSQSRKVELVIDRQTGEVLERKVKTRRHGD